LTAKRGKIDGPCIDELSHTGLRRALQNSGESDGSVMGQVEQSGKPPQSVSIRQLMNGRDTQTLFIGAMRSAKVGEDGGAF
jgi:hypothetical protein